MLSIKRRYHFEAAHFLPHVRDGHKCKNMHGHNYEFIVEICGDIDREKGWLIDFWDLDKIVQPIVAEIDHKILNEIKGLENPTAENIAEWLLCSMIYEGIQIGFDFENLLIKSIEVFETKDCSATFTCSDDET